MLTVLRSTRPAGEFNAPPRRAPSRGPDPKNSARSFAANRRQRTRACGVFVCLLLLGPARCSPLARSHRRVSSSNTGGGVPAFVVRPSASGSSTRGSLKDWVRRAELPAGMRSSRARGTASMAVTAGLETADIQSRCELTPLGCIAYFSCVSWYDSCTTTVLILIVVVRF